MNSMVLLRFRNALLILGDIASFFEFVTFFFLHKGRTQTGPEAALDGGFTDYTEDLKRKEKYNMTLNFYKKNPTKIKEKSNRVLLHRR